MCYQKRQWQFSILRSPVKQLKDSNERWPETHVWFQALTFLRWKASRAPPTTDKGQFQMLHFLSSQAICKSFLPSKIIFSRERKKKKKQQLFSLLRAAVVFCCSNKVCARSGLDFAEMWLCRVRTAFPPQVQKRTVTSRTSALQKQLQLPHKAAWGTGGLLIHRTAPLKLTVMPWDIQRLKAGCAMPVFTAAPWFLICTSTCQSEHTNIGFV